MAEIIKVSTEEMRHTVTEFIAAQRELDEAYKWMDRAVKMLDNCWKGTAYSVMRTQWTVTYNNIARADERMQDAIDELNKSAELFDSNESVQISSFQALDMGTSPFD